MDMKNYEVIIEIYHDMMEERERHIAELTEKRNRIDQIDSYINSLLSKEENDLQIFLPRKAENIYRDDIEKNRREKEKLCLECDNLQRYIQSENIKIEKLDRVLFDISTMLHVKHFSSVSISSLQNLAQFISKIQSVSANLEKGDNVQAKTYMSGMKQDIDLILKDIRNSLFDVNPVATAFSDELSLKDMLDGYFDILNLNHPFRIKADIDEIQVDHSDFAKEILFISIYRIIIEYVSSSVKYLSDNKIIIKIKKQKYKYWIVIKDKVEYDTTNSSLDTIKETVALLGGSIDIKLNKGISIDIKIPC